MASPALCNKRSTMKAQWPSWLASSNRKSQSPWSTLCRYVWTKRWQRPRQEACSWHCWTKQNRFGLHDSAQMKVIYTLQVKRPPLQMQPCFFSFTVVASSGSLREGNPFVTIKSLRIPALTHHDSTPRYCVHLSSALSHFRRPFSTFSWP